MSRSSVRTPIALFLTSALCSSNELLADVPEKGARRGDLVHQFGVILQRARVEPAGSRLPQDRRSQTGLTNRAAAEAFQQAGVVQASDLNNLFDRTLALFLRRRKGRQQHRRQDRDNRNHHQQLDQGERTNPPEVRFAGTA